MSGPNAAPTGCDTTTPIACEARGMTRPQGAASDAPVTGVAATAPVTGAQRHSEESRTRVRPPALPACLHLGAHPAAVSRRRCDV
jgi:hypothetical protein